MHSLAQRVLSQVRRDGLLSAGDRVGVAVSGGIDSVALLRVLIELRSELGIVLSVVHFNHKLRGAESDADQKFVADLARRHDLEFYCDSDDVAQHAAEEHLSVEAAARELRYGFFRHLIEENRIEESNVNPPTSPKSGEKWSTRRGIVDKIVTGHTLDDQAETVLMRAVRGAGLRGLGGIYPRIPVEDDDGEVCGEIVRPLLALRRQELERYLQEIGQPWREDSSNADHAFMRNRVRRLVLPQIEKELNPAAAENLSELAEIARGEEDYWENEVAGWMGTGVHWSEPDWAKPKAAAGGLIQIAAPSAAEGELRARIESAAWLVMNASVDRLWFLGEPLAVQRRLVKAIGEEAGVPLEFKHIEEILRFAAGEDHAGKTLALPLGWKLTQDEHEIVFLTPDLREPEAAADYEYELAVPGRVLVRETGMIVEARCVTAGEAGYNPDQLLDAASVEATVRVRNWRAGDRFWPAHTKSPKKIKELLQERHVAAAERRAWPVIVMSDVMKDVMNDANDAGDAEILWVRGFCSPAKMRPKPGRRAILIEEIPAGTGLDD